MSAFLLQHYEDSSMLPFTLSKSLSLLTNNYIIKIINPLLTLIITNIAQRTPTDPSRDFYKSPLPPSHFI